MRALRIAVLTALLVTMAGSPAMAASPGSTPTWASCYDSSGEIVDLTVETYSGSKNYRVHHTITPCSESMFPWNVYAAALYFADGTAVGAPKPYPAPGTGVRAIGVLTVRSDAVAVCLITSWNYRIACAEIAVDAAGVETLGPPLSVYDPRVAVPADVPPLVRPPGPTCPSCMW